jgi:hypothetical protein
MMALVASAVLATLAMLGGCGGSHAAPAGSSHLVTSDHWSPPAVSGPPSTESFCTVVVALYRHEAELPQAANVKVREELLSDYTATVPRLLAAAPPPIAGAARSYFEPAAAVYAQLIKVGLDYHKLRAGSLAPLASKAFELASQAVISFTQSHCHYTIGG